MKKWIAMVALTKGAKEMLGDNIDMDCFIDFLGNEVFKRTPHPADARVEYSESVSLRIRGSEEDEGDESKSVCVFQADMDAIRFTFDADSEYLKEAATKFQGVEK